MTFSSCKLYLKLRVPIEDCMNVDIVDEEIEICSATPLVAINDFMQKPSVEVAGLYDEDDVNK